MNQHRVADSIVDAVGETPLIRLHRVVPDHGVELFGKVEARNPAGSVKDRVGLSMIRAAEIAGVLRKGMTIVEATSGNTGIALAMAAAALGYTLVLTMPEHMSVERRAVIASYGAKIILTESVLDMQGAIDRAEQLRAADPDGVFIPGQFENPANPQVHRDTTAVEILDGLDGALAAFVAGVGTGGTITGIGQALKQHSRSIRVIAVEPSRSAVLSGGKPDLHEIQGIGAGFVPPVLDQNTVDEVVAVEDDVAFDFARRLTREEGLLVGPSSGANVAAALRVAESLQPGQRVVTILCDTGFRYLSVDGFVHRSSLDI